MPGKPEFAVTNTTPLLITSVGQPFFLSGWAKKRITNGDTNKFAYLEQFFDKAYEADANGNATTNETGILSEYGEFFPTEPGRTCLKTKPDIDTSGMGSALVHVIKIALDVNHDGVMDLSFGGPDNTSSQRPFLFWWNNDCDRVGSSVTFTSSDITNGIIEFTESLVEPEEDDLLPTDKHLPTAQKFPDYAYTTNGIPAIPTPRDLEDYTRLWFPGISNLVLAAPTNWTVELGWRDSQSSNPSLRIFSAAEHDGGIGYLTNQSLAEVQIGNGAGTHYVGLVAPGQSVLLNTCGGCIPSEHYIFYGAQRGNGELVLRVRNGNGDTVAETSAFIQIKDIKEMYERWTVGDASTREPMLFPLVAGNDLPKGPPAFQYPHSAGEADIPYILFVHGWNMNVFAKDRFAETAFKRLYWQGYQGRYGSFRWPTTDGFPSFSLNGLFSARAQLNSFDDSDLQSWKSGLGLKRTLTILNNRYPDQVRMFAHSHGNTAAAEALKLAAPNTVQVYAAMQAAVASHDYDATAPTRTVQHGDAGTPDLHANYSGAGIPYLNGINGAASFVNFYNPVDWALALWEIDQDLKPNESRRYHYDPGLSVFYQNVGLTGTRYLALSTNTFELFAYCVESRCYAVGQQAGMGGAFQQQEQLLDPTFAFGNHHKGHSAQFLSNNAQRAPFWKEVMISLNLTPLP